MKVIAAIPYRPDKGQRDRIWTHLSNDFWPHTDCTVKLSWHTDGLFNRSAAINRAADCAWDVMVIADSDTFVPLRQLAQSIYTAHDNNVLTAAFTEVHELTETVTEKLIRLESTPFDTLTIRTRDLETQSSMLAIPRPLWESLGGMDERFKGWGCEDNAFWHACRIHGGEPQRIPGPAYHMWHPPADGKHFGPHYRRNRDLWNRYQRCTTIEDLKRC